LQMKFSACEMQMLLYDGGAFNENSNYDFTNLSKRAWSKFRTRIALKQNHLPSRWFMIILLSTQEN